VPEKVKGISYPVQEKVGRPDLQWEYLPTILREMTPIGTSQKFLGTTFTYGDLDLVDLCAHTYKFLSMEKHAGAWAYKLEETPRQPWYYARIITWVASDSFLLLQRNYYVPSQELWRIERFAEIKRIDGVPTPLWIPMENLRDGNRTTINVSAVRSDADIPATLFDPDRLPTVLTSTTSLLVSMPLVSQQTRRRLLTYHLTMISTLRVMLGLVILRLGEWRP
jgi:hypothetical protein